MPTRLRRSLLSNTLIAILLAVTSIAVGPARPSHAARPSAPPGPDRVTTITVNYTAYEWWMATWRKNRVVCTLTVDHEGQPTLAEVYRNCDTNVYLTFKKQPSCEPLVDRRECVGYYLVLVSTTQSQRQMTVLLPPPVVWLSLEGCDAVARLGTNICEGQAILVLRGQEPLPNEHITRIEGTMNGQPFSCDPVCKLILAPTGSQGVDLQFWA